MTANSISNGFCRDCLKAVADADQRCKNCHSRRLARHPELHALSIAHIDCDAFYASVEKRDNPDLKDKPVIVGGGVRGVVSTACYVARIHGVRSAMPMFKALKLCPDAVVIKPNMSKYSSVGREVRALMEKLTPLVEPLSIDEAFLDLSGTDRLHGRSPALSLAALLQDIEAQLGITASAGLSYNKYLAKVASDLEKPKGFSVIGRQEAKTFLAAQSVRLIWGVGAAFQKQLQQDGITLIGQLQEMDLALLMKRYGVMGSRLYHLSRGEDVRHVSSHEASKSISSETTFNTDIADFVKLEAVLWQLAERVSKRAKAEGMAGHTITLKLKKADFSLRTRSTAAVDATNLAHIIFTAAQPLLRKEADGTHFRLIGVGISNLVADAGDAGPALDTRYRALTEAERAMDTLRARFGSAAIGKGRSLRSTDD